MAILAADVAGYSRLMAADERATVAALDSARSVFRSNIEANQGRVIDMAGDSVLAVFETATGAVSAALGVQGQFNGDAEPGDRRMRFRIQDSRSVTSTTIGSASDCATNFEAIVGCLSLGPLLEANAATFNHPHRHWRDARFCGAGGMATRECDLGYTNGISIGD